MSLYGWFVVILLTSAALLLGVGWLMEHADRRLERITLLDQLDQATANVQLPRPGRLPYQGAQDPAYELDRTYGGKVHDIHGGPGQNCWCGYIGHNPAPIPWDLAGAAYQLGQQRAAQDEITRQVDEIMLEVELHPEKWRGER